MVLFFVFLFEVSVVVVGNSWKPNMQATVNVCSEKYFTPNMLIDSEVFL